MRKSVESPAPPTWGMQGNLAARDFSATSDASISDWEHYPRLTQGFALLKPRTNVTFGFSNSWSIPFDQVRVRVHELSSFSHRRQAYCLPGKYSGISQVVACV